MGDYEVILPGYTMRKSNLTLIVLCMFIGACKTADSRTLPNDQYATSNIHDFIKLRTDFEERISVFSDAWFIEFFPDGSVTAQYGSTFGDFGLLPPRTVNYQALHQSCVEQKTDEFIPGNLQVLIWHKDNNSNHIAKYMRDDSMLRETINRIMHGPWKSFDAERFEELLHQYPILPHRYTTR